MKQENCKILKLEEFQKGIYELTFISKYISKKSKPGQFVNIKIDSSSQPLFRRPFSVSDVEGDKVKLMFNVFGIGTKKLITKKIAETIDVIGPLGNSFVINSKFKNPVIIAGGLGAAPFPFLTKKINNNVKTILGARSENLIITKNLKNIFVSTDDGSMGFKGNVVELAKKLLKMNKIKPDVIYTCGPSVMLKAVARFAEENKIKCYASWECEMACGIGLCQGCPIEIKNGNKKFKLVCCEGPNFDTSEIKI